MKQLCCYSPENVKAADSQYFLSEILFAACQCYADFLPISDGQWSLPNRNSVISGLQKKRTCGAGLGSNPRPRLVYMDVLPTM